MPFVIGDSVTPRPGWDKDATNFAQGHHPALVPGVVEQIEPMDKGQRVKVSGNPWMLAGCFERVDSP